MIQSLWKVSVQLHLGKKNLLLCTRITDSIYIYKKNHIVINIVYLRSKKRRRANRTGFPSPKKKRKVDVTKNSSEKASVATKAKSVESKSEQKKAPLSKSSFKSDKSKSNSQEKASPKKSVSKQLKMDRFITSKSASKTPTADKSKSSSSPVVPLVAGRRSVALKAKNYR